MSDNVIPLRANAAGFAFDVYEYDDEGIGLIEPDEGMPKHTVVVITEPRNGRGVAMTAESARKLGEALIVAAAMADKA